jgi:hypothetical protein
MCASDNLKKKNKFFNDEIQIIGKCACSEGWLRSIKKKKDCKIFGQCVCVLFDRAECMVIRHLSGLVIAGLKEFYPIMLQV